MEGSRSIASINLTNGLIGITFLVRIANGIESRAKIQQMLYYQPVSGVTPRTAVPNLVLAKKSIP
jgi:hypothetical protein